MKTWMKILCVLFLLGSGVHAAKAATQCSVSNNNLTVTVFPQQGGQVVGDGNAGTTPIPLGPWQSSQRVAIGSCPRINVWGQIQLSAFVTQFALTAADAGCRNRPAGLMAVKLSNGQNSPIAVAMALTLSAGNEPPSAANTMTCLSRNMWKPTIPGSYQNTNAVYATLWVRPYLIAPAASGTSLTLADGDDNYFLNGIAFGPDSSQSNEVWFTRINIQYNRNLTFVTPTCGFVPDVYQSLGNHAPTDFATVGAESAYYPFHLIADQACNVTNMRLTFQGNSYPGFPNLFATYGNDGTTSTGLGVDLWWDGSNPSPIEIKPNDSLDMPVLKGIGALYPFKAKLVHPDNGPVQSGAGHADITIQNFYY